MPAELPSKSISRSIPWPALWLIVVAQAAVHLVLLPVGGWIGDTLLLQSWAARLSGHSASTFYGAEPRVDHLPGDLWILRLEAWVYHIISGNAPGNDGFLNALKLGPGLADVAIAVVLFLLAREIKSAVAGRRAALLFALNPAPYFISMVWGVADSVSFFFAALALFLTIRRAFWAAVPVLTYACLVKPQLGVLAPLLLIFHLHDALHRTGVQRWRRIGLELVAAGIASAAVLFATLLPFSVGLPLMHERWSLTGRITFAANLYTNTTLNAFNLWAFISARTLAFPGNNAPIDHEIGRLGLTYQHWAIALTVIACVILTLPLIRKGGEGRLVWTCTAVTFAFFMLQTRIHERYFFPAIVLMALAVALRPRWTLVYVVMSAVYFGNIWWVYKWLEQPRSLRGALGGGATGRNGLHGVPRSRGGGISAFPVPSSNEVRALVLVNLAVLGFFLAYAILDFRKPTLVQVDAAEAISIDAPSPHTDTEWPPMPETGNQSPV